jgi:hypothetical protein
MPTEADNQSINQSYNTGYMNQFAEKWQSAMINGRVDGRLTNLATRGEEAWIDQVTGPSGVTAYVMSGDLPMHGYRVLGVCTEIKDLMAPGDSMGVDAAVDRVALLLEGGTV